MAEFFSSGRIVDLILGLAFLESMVLAVHFRKSGRGIPLVELAGNMAAGGCLLLALRAALTGAWWGWIAMLLTGALLAHALDLWCRWHR